MTTTIEKITAIPVNIPYRTVPVMSAGASAYSTRTVIVVETSDGITGLGEASYAFPAGIIERDFAPALVGLDALDHALLRRHCLPGHLDFGTPALKMRLATWGGLEIALWDILGKRSGQPVYKLLGGAFRRHAPFVAYAYAQTESADIPESMVRQAVEAIGETGAPIFEFKVGVHPLEVEIETVRAVHAALSGKAQIAVDANMGLSFDAARRLVSAVAPLLENFEEPSGTLREMQQLASEFGVDVSTHCSDLDIVTHYPGIRGIVPTLDVAGGIANFRRLSEILTASGRRVWLRSHAESGIGWAAMVHLGISLPGLVRPAQSLIDLIEDDLVLGETWHVRSGGVVPPDVPGLGIELDRDAVRRCHRIFLEKGEIQAFAPTPQ